MSERLKFSSSVLDTFENASSIWESPMFGRSKKFKFINDAGKLLEQSVGLQDTGFRLTRMVTTGHELEIEVEGVNTLLVPLTGHVGYRTGSTEILAKAGVSAILSRPTSRWSIVDPINRDECEALVFQLPDGLDISEGSGSVSEALHGFPDVFELRVNGVATSRFLRYLRLLALELTPENPIAPTARYVTGMTFLLEESLRDAIGEAMGYFRDENRIEPRDLWRARAAEDIIRTRFSEALSVKGIARELGINVRSLQLAFKNVYKISPRQMIANIRLEQAHMQLLHAGQHEQVTTIAWRCGITHLGRFAQAYREKYGETPNAALATGHRQIRSIK